jgi:hypothetical protein
VITPARNPTTTNVIMEDSRRSSQSELRATRVRPELPTCAAVAMIVS